MKKINLKLTALSETGPMAFMALHEDDEKRLHIWIDSNRKPDREFHCNKFTGDTYPDGRKKTKHSERSLYAAANRDFRKAVEALKPEDFQAALNAMIAKRQQEEATRRVEAIVALQRQAASLGFKLVPVSGDFDV